MGAAKRDPIAEVVSASRIGLSEPVPLVETKRSNVLDLAFQTQIIASREACNMVEKATSGRHALKLGRDEEMVDEPTWLPNRDEAYQSTAVRCDQEKFTGR